MSINYYLKEYYDAKEFTNLPNTSSKGAQEKFSFIDENGLTHYVKKDTHGYESLAEVTVWDILNECSNLDKDLLVRYDEIKVDGACYCISPDFKRTDEDEITLAQIFDYGRFNFDKYYNNLSPEDKLAKVVKAIQNYTGVNFDKELRLMLAVDSFFLNEDRHLNNISFLQDSEGGYRLSPLFDNGMSLMSRFREYPLNNPLSINMRKVKTHSLISTHPVKQVALYNGEPFLIKSKIQNYLDDNKVRLGRVHSIISRQLNSKDYAHLFKSEVQTPSTFN